MAIKQNNGSQTQTRQKEEIEINLEEIIQGNNQDKAASEARRKAEEKRRANQQEPKDKQLAYELRFARAMGATQKDTLKEKIQVTLYKVSPEILKNAMLREKKREQKIYDQASDSLQELQRQIKGKVEYQSSLNEEEFNDTLSVIPTSQKGLEYKFLESMDKLRFTAEKYKRSRARLDDLHKKHTDIKAYISQNEDKKDSSEVSQVQRKRQELADTAEVIHSVKGAYNTFSRQLKRDKNQMLQAENNYIKATTKLEDYNDQLDDSNGYLMFVDGLINEYNTAGGEIQREELFAKLRPQQDKYQRVMEVADENDFIKEVQQRDVPAYSGIEITNAKLKEERGKANIGLNEAADKIIEEYAL